jgi:hypothetical protein
LAGCRLRKMTFDVARSCVSVYGRAWDRPAEIGNQSPWRQHNRVPCSARIPLLPGLRDAMVSGRQVAEGFAALADEPHAGRRLLEASGC